MTGWIIHNEKLETWASSYTGPKFHAVLADPPYGIHFMPGQTKGWDRKLPAKEWAAALLKVLHPGALLMLFGSPRTYHRLACGFEDAGFRVIDCLQYLYGTGFPKSLRTDAPGFENHRTPALKPSWEPILFMKAPGLKTHKADALKHGTGGLNINAARIGTDTVGWNGNGSPGYSGSLDNDSDARPVKGRYPANLVTDEYIAEELGAKSKFFYCAKASRKERDAGLGEIEPVFSPTMGNGIGGKEHDPQTATKKRNPHPCVKPLSLTKWLATLLLPPASIGERRLLVPFSGSGSEMIGALQAGWDSVTGVEMSEEYVGIAEKRIAHWIQEETQKVA